MDGLKYYMWKDEKWMYISCQLYWINHECKQVFLMTSILAYHLLQGNGNTYDYFGDIF